MENSSNSLYELFKKVNEIDIVEYLASQGIHWKSDRNGKAWYHSPIRDGDATTSFVVYRNSNTWHDYGTGEGTTLVDLGMKLHNCKAIDFVSKFEDLTVTPRAQPAPNTSEKDVKTEILGVQPLSYYPVVDYIHSRKIPLEIARKHLVEVRFKIYKEQLAAGFRNDSGGYELRNSIFKGSSFPKDSTFINNGSSILEVTEGSFDFLSRLTMLTRQEARLPNFLVLNGTGLFNRKIPLMREHDLVTLLLDHGKGGRKFTQIGLSVDKHKFRDGSMFYCRHDDINDWWKREGYRIVQKPPPRHDDTNNRGLRR